MAFKIFESWWVSGKLVRIGDAIRWLKNHEDAGQGDERWNLNNVIDKFTPAIVVVVCEEMESLELVRLVRVLASTALSANGCCAEDLKNEMREIVKRFAQ